MRKRSTLWILQRRRAHNPRPTPCNSAKPCALEMPWPSPPQLCECYSRYCYPLWQSCSGMPFCCCVLILCQDNHAVDWLHMVTNNIVKACNPLACTSPVGHSSCLVAIVPPTGNLHKAWFLHSCLTFLGIAVGAKGLFKFPLHMIEDKPEELEVIEILRRIG